MPKLRLKKNPKMAEGHEVVALIFDDKEFSKLTDFGKY